MVCETKGRGITRERPVLKEKAIQYAEELGIENFKASNGWFERWKSRHEITFKIVSGEAQSCTKEMTASWEESTLKLRASRHLQR